MSLWHRLGFGRERADAAALEQQVNALQSALARCKGVARQWYGRRRALEAVGAVVIFAAGFWLGANREPLTQSVVGLVPALDFISPAPDSEAAYAAYEKGDPARALRLSRPLAEQGDVRAQSLLGLIHSNGRSALRDDAEAARWFRLAADQGDAGAQFRLGVMYFEGQGVTQDHDEAVSLYRLAADQGYAQAQYNLGVLYATGEAVEQDNVTAHMWFNLAVASFPASDTRNRNAAVQSRDVVAAKLTREQLAEAQRLAREWKPVRRTQQQAAGTA
jgi:uncharacterized protein